MYCLQHKLRLHKCLSVHPFCLFSVQSCHFLPGDNLFSGCGIVAGQICVYDSIVRSSTEHGGKELQTMNHKTWPSGRGRLWTISPPPPFQKKTQIQAHKVRFGGAKGASCTCWVANGVLSEDCWQRQLGPFGLKLEVTEIQQNQWDSGAVWQDYNR